MKKVLLLIVLSSCTVVTRSQDSTLNVYFWLNGGVCQVFDIRGNSLLGGNLGLNLSLKQKHFVQARFYGASDFLLFPAGEAVEHSLSEINGVWLMYGRGKYLKPWLLLLPTIGFSAGEWRYRGERTGAGSGLSLGDTYDYDKSIYIGVPVNLSLMFNTSVAGGSLDLFAHFHPHPEFGLGINLHFGVIRDGELTRSD